MKFIHICSFKRPSLFWWGLCGGFVNKHLVVYLKRFFIEILPESWVWPWNYYSWHLKVTEYMKKPRPKLFHQNFCVTAPSAELFQLLFFSSSDRNIQLRKFKAKQGWREEKQNRENQFCVCFWLLQKVLMSIEKKRSKRKSFKWSSPLASISHRFFALFWVCEWIRSDRGLLLGVLDVSSIAICLHILLIDAGTQRMFPLCAINPLEIARCLARCNRD